MTDRRYMVTCTVCGAPVDTLEQHEGGSAEGCQLVNDEWACSRACWEKAALSELKGKKDD